MRWIPLIVLLSLPTPAQTIDYRREIEPILEDRCVACHNADRKAAGISFDSEEATRAVGRNLVNVISGDKPRMPRGSAPLEAKEVEIITKWVEQTQKQAWWSLRPLPAYKPATIDQFLFAKLKEKGIAPSPEAPRNVLIRRLTFDLHGLPPTPEEVQNFLADKSPNAYENLVDRLLQSPRYGERWARHWLDVVHYGDSHGYDKDKPRLNAWPYRDYVINALNNDKPYTQFVQQQIAGDILEPQNIEAKTATGFLAAGPWDFVGHQELREGTTDKNLTRLLDRDDMLMATLSTFTSTTAHCARCHNHKFDPIPQIDYYRLQAVFAGVDRADQPIDADPAIYQQRQKLLARKLRIQRELQPLLDQVEYAASPEITALDDRIRDAKNLLAHLGTPKTEAEQAEKAALTARAAADQASRQKLVDVIVGTQTYSTIDKLKGNKQSLDDELQKLPKPRQVYAAASYFERAGNFRPSLEPRRIHVLNRGNVTEPGALVGPGALSLLKNVPYQPPADPENEALRRASLAQWITEPANVLTWRSIVNRVWHYHFGQGIVDTPNDFGRMGSTPSHPELLDWLAVWFRDEAKGSLKQLHRAIVSSKAYRQSSANREDAAKLDADNRLLWRMNRGRLDAESIHDAVLAVAGKLDDTAGGPPVRMFGFKDDHSPVYDYAAFSPDAPGAYRRSIYRFLVRSVPDPFFDRLDCPDASLLAPKRSTTLTAIQALALWNNPFMLRMSEHFAAANTLPSAAIRLFSRELTNEETQKYEQYAAKHGKANLARLLFNTNEFLFID